MSFRTLGNICLVLAILLIIYVVVRLMNDEAFPEEQPNPDRQVPQATRLLDDLTA